MAFLLQVRCEIWGSRNVYTMLFDLPSKAGVFNKNQELHLTVEDYTF